MDQGHPSDPAATYVRVLAGFGLDDAAVLDLHGGDPGEDPVECVRSSHAGADGQKLFAGLRRALVRSSRGVALPAAGETPPDPERVGDPLTAFGYDLELAPADRGYDVTVTDAVSGLREEGTFRFPDGPLGDGNVPALAHAVEGLLERQGLRYVLLTPGPSRWRLVAVDDGDLAALRATFGDRVTVSGRPLLAAHQPPDYAGGAPPDSAYVAGGVDSGLGEEVSEDSRGDDHDGGDGNGSGHRTDAGSPHDTPEWIRAAAAREGGIDAVVDALSESGPRTHVSGRTADDVLAEVPEFSGGGTTETRSAGVDDVLERIRGHEAPGGGPSTATSDRPIDVFENGPAGEGGGDRDAEDWDEDESDGPPPDAEPAGEESRVEADRVSGDRGEDPGSELEERPGPEDYRERVDSGDNGSLETDPAESDTGAEGEDSRVSDRFDSLVGGSPDEVVVGESVDDIISGGGESCPPEVEPEPESKPEYENSPEGSDGDREGPREEPPTWKPVPEAERAQGAGESPAEGAASDEDGTGTDSGVGDLIEDAESDAEAVDWQPVGSDSPIRDAESKAEEAASGPPESRFDGAMRPSDLDSDGDEDDEDDDGPGGVIGRIRDAFDRMRSG